MLCLNGVTFHQHFLPFHFDYYYLSNLLTSTREERWRSINRTTVKKRTVSGSNFVWYCMEISHPFSNLHTLLIFYIDEVKTSQQSSVFLIVNPHPFALYSSTGDRQCYHYSRRYAWNSNARNPIVALFLKLVLLFGFQRKI